jgi:hypothetical protein
MPNERRRKVINMENKLEYKLSLKRYGYEKKMDTNLK